MRETQTRVFNVAAVGASDIVIPDAGSRIAVWALSIFNVAAQDIQVFQDADPITGIYAGFPALSGFMWQPGPRPHWILNPGSRLVMQCSGGTQVTGHVSYTLIKSQTDLESDSLLSVSDLRDAILRLPIGSPDVGSLNLNLQTPGGITAAQRSALVDLLRGLLGGRV